MSASLKMIDFQKAQYAINKALSNLVEDRYVTVGIHESADPPNSQMTMAKLGSIHHFGADIDHPGGTRYVIGKDGMASFVPNNFVGPVSGITKPHKINIPARPWLDVGVAAGNKEYLDIIAEGIDNGLSPEQILDQVGLEAVGQVQTYMTNLKSPPNARSTIRKKGSDNPLIDTGAMRGSVTYVQANVKPQEGL